MTIPGPNATREERAELALAFAERFVAFWDEPPTDEWERLVAVSRFVAELVIHASVPDRTLGYSGAEDTSGLTGYKGWRARLGPLFPNSLGLYVAVEPFDPTTGELELDHKPMCGDALDDLADIMCELEDVLRVREESDFIEAFDVLLGGYRYHLGHAHAAPLLHYIDRTLLRRG